MTGRREPPGDSPTSTSRSLLRGVREHDPEAWDRLVSLYAPTVVLWCRRMRLREQEIPDVLQEVFQTVATRLHQFRREQASHTFRGWLRTVTRNKVLDFLRREEKQAAAAGGTEAQSRMAAVPAADADRDEISDEIENDLMLRALESVRSHFAPHTWKAFWMVVVEGRPTSDVADELGMQPGGVRVAKSRVLSRLRFELGDAPGDEEPAENA